MAAAVGSELVTALLAYTFGMLLATVALVLWIFVWLLVAVRVVRRDDLGAGGKVLWLVVILVLPLVGLLAYFLWDATRTTPT
jgi:hypothetical protein